MQKSISGTMGYGGDAGEKITLASSDSFGSSRDLSKDMQHVPDRLAETPRIDPPQIPTNECNFCLRSGPGAMSFVSNFMSPPF